jgi:nitroimidazol reductase NimA-like FMN-containing flavoprotein (pyridoxamine 5'-phosphate oxidase superfamily)
MLSNHPETMPNKELKDYIIKFLADNNMCVFATCLGDAPRATPIEYHSDGLSMFFEGEPGLKIKNLAANPNVSIGIYLPYTGWDSVKGAQITGKAELVKKGTPEFSECLSAYQWEKTAKQFGITEFPSSLQLIRVDPSKIEFIDMSLKKLGYSPRQVLTVSKKMKPSY